MKNNPIECLLGLDISTSCIGICILEIKTGQLMVLDHIDLKSKKFDNEYKKADFVKTQLEQIITPEYYKIENIYIEEAVKMFGKGFSSAGTITTLNRFNGIISYLIYGLYNNVPKMINVRSARAKLGIKVNQNIKKQVSSKQQVFEQVMALNPNITWITHIAKNGKLKGQIVYDKENFDRCDAFVICKAAQLL